MALKSVSVFVQAIRQVFSNKKYALLGGAAFVLSATLFFFLPVLLIPSNSPGLQASIYGASSWVTLLVFAVLAGIVVPMQAFVIARRMRNKARSAGSGLASMASVLAAGMFSIKACPVCLAVIFGFLGFPAILLLLEHSLEFSFLAIALAGISIHFTSKNIVEHCKECSAKGPPSQKKC